MPSDITPEIRDIKDRPDSEVAHSLSDDDMHTDGATPFAPPPGPPPGKWRVAASLLKLRDQINAKYPKRNKASDGTIGDERHCPGGSDHCPNTLDGNVGVVTALDITHDPANGVDAGAIAEALRLSQDPRIQYIISNGQIANASALDGKPPFAWRKYNGKNKHDKHFHVSVHGQKTGVGGYDTTTNWSAV